MRLNCQGKGIRAALRPIKDKDGGLPWWSSGLHFAFQCGGAGSTPGWGAKSPHAFRPKRQSMKQKQYCSKFNKDFKKTKRSTSKKIIVKEIKMKLLVSQEICMCVYIYV